MKVLITTEWNLPVINGVVISVNNLREELTKLGHEVKVVTLSNTQLSNETDGVISIGSLGAGKIYPGARFTIPLGNKYIKEIIRWNPDVIHSQSEFSTFLLARYLSKRLHVPIVHTYHTVYENYTHYFSPVEKWGKTMASLFTTSTLKHTSCVIAPTEKVRKLLVGYGVTKPIKVVPTGIHMNNGGDLTDNKKLTALRAKIGIDTKTKVLVTVGRLAKEKNIEEILQYFSMLERTDLKLLIVGDGPHRQQLEKHAELLGIADKVFFAGMVPHDTVNQYYQIGDVFVSASNSETQGLTYLEAMSNGLPALCRKDSCLDNVIHDGENGWQYQSFEQFREQLGGILQNEEEYQRLSNNAKTTAMRDYSSAVFAQKVDVVYVETVRRYQKQHALPSAPAIGYAW
jgi:1,2-diacylglycerol 3-alpha-glucosyltransferase